METEETTEQQVIARFSEGDIVEILRYPTDMEILESGIGEPLSGYVGETGKITTVDTSDPMPAYDVLFDNGEEFFWPETCITKLSKWKLKKLKS